MNTNAPGCLIRVRPSKRSSVEAAPAAGAFSLPRRPQDRPLQLLDLVPAFFQQGNDTTRTGKVQRTGYNCSRFAAFQLRLDPRNPFDVSLINKTRGDPGSLFPKLRVSGPKCRRVAFSPRLEHPLQFGGTILVRSQGITQNDFTIAI